MDYSDFTNLYSLTKTLRFQLVPEPNTEYWLQQKRDHGQSPIEMDEEIDHLYKTEMKPLYDEAHRLFIQETLQNLELDQELLQECEEIHRRLQTLNKKKYNDLSPEEKQEKTTIEKRFDEVSKKLREQVVQNITQTAEEWKARYPEVKFKKSGYKILLEKDSLDLLKQMFPEKSDIIDTFIGFHTYFGGFNDNRENYYTTQGNHTEIANRIINENLIRFLDNRLAVREIQNHMPHLPSTGQDFALEKYPEYVLQEQIDWFNKDVVGQINSAVNLHMQQTKTKLPKLKTLYKQIGSEKKSVDILIIEEGQEWTRLQELVDNQMDFLPKIRDRYQEFFDQPEDFDLNLIFFNSRAVANISQRWFSGGWFVLSEVLRKQKAFGGKKDNVTVKNISLAQIKQALETLDDSTVETLFRSGTKDKPNLFREQAFVADDFWQTFLNIWRLDLDSLFTEGDNYQKEFQEKKTQKFDKEQDHEWLKALCDAFLNLERRIKDNKLKDSENGDAHFYEYIDRYLEESKATQYYNAFRNYITQKPYSTDKIALNFENGQLLGGWSDGQERNKGGVILRKGDRYYLGVLKNRGLFRTDKDNPIYHYSSEEIPMQRLILYNLKFQTLAGRGFIRDYGEGYGEMGKRDPERAIRCLQELIKHQYLDKYPALEPLVNTSYHDKKAFDADVKDYLQEAFVMNFVDVRDDLVNQAVKDGDLYLFQIQTKDWKKDGDSKDDLQTLYWKGLFSPENLTRPILALNGGGEIFWREGQHEKLKRKTDSYGKEVLDAKRYAEDTYLFHVPIMINRDKPKAIKFKDTVNAFLKEHRDDITYLGLDRGEKHLIYYCLIDSHGEIIGQGSFNRLDIGGQEVDFHQKLTERADSMMEARKNWHTIGSIKEMKEGYLSHVIHQIYQLMLEHNAVIVMEDLNTQFKAKRTAKVEKSVYKKFEMALAKKLNYLVLKDRKIDQIGGVLHGYQLTPYIDTVDYFEKAKQWGMIFYERAAYTSTTDPLTGWRKHIYINNSAPIAKIQPYFGADGQIEVFYDHDFQCVAFRYHYDGTEWILHAHRNMTRFRWKASERTMEHIDVAEELLELFHDFDFGQSFNLQMTERGDDFSWKRLAFLWNLVNQIRNTDREVQGDDSDFIQSPVYSPDIQDFFDSRQSDQYRIRLPENGDANGAYHIALNGRNRVLSEQ